MKLLDNESLKNSPDLSDEKLFLASKDKPYLFTEILDRYQDAFLRKANQIIRNESDAEDIVQTTFTKLYLNVSKFTSQGDGSFKAWAYKVLVNTAYSHYQKLKKNRYLPISDELEEILPDVKGLAASEQKELADYINSVLTRIPDHFASALSRFLLEGKSQEEIAKEDGISIGAVKTRIYRAKEAFRKSHFTIA